MVRWRWSFALALRAMLPIVFSIVQPGTPAQEQPPNSNVAPLSPLNSGVPLTASVEADGGKTLPIDLPSALQLASVQAVDIAAAAERIRVAAAVLEQAHALWLPTITVGGDYNRHDGKIQDVGGNIIDSSRSSLLFGLGTGIGAGAGFS